MNKILIVSALYQEIEAVEHYIEGKSDWKKISANWYVNDKSKKEVFVKVLGVGKVNAAIETTDAINQVNPDLIVNVGVAGGLDDKLSVGSLVIGTDYVQVDLKTILPENMPVINDTPDYIIEKLSEIAKKKALDYKTGRIATGDFVLYEGRKRRQIKREYNPLAFDMETAAVAQVATAKGIDFVGIRSFSDMANKKTITKLSSNIQKGKNQELRKKVFSEPVELILDYIDIA